MEELKLVNPNEYPSLILTNPKETQEYKDAVQEGWNCKNIEDVNFLLNKIMIPGDNLWLFREFRLLKDSRKDK